MRSKGFTLLELLVVIAIIGLLAGIATISFGSARAKARDARRVSEVKQYQNALNLYADNNTAGTYPDGTAAELGTTNYACLDNSGLIDTATCGTGSRGTKLVEKINLAPTPNDGSCTTTNNKYIYTVTAPDKLDYTIAFCLGNSTGGISSGVRSATRNGIN